MEELPGTARINWENFCKTEPGQELGLRSLATITARVVRSVSAIDVETDFGLAMSDGSQRTKNKLKKLAERRQDVITAAEIYLVENTNMDLIQVKTYLADKIMKMARSRVREKGT